MTPADLVAATLAVAIGSVVQALSGVGAGFLMVPMLAWIDLELVPGPMIFASLSLSGIMMVRERGSIDSGRLGTILAGLVPGCIAGGYILTLIPVERLGLMFGTVLLLAIGVTASGIRIPLNRTSALGCGFVSGAMGASTGVGAPALALLYQHESGPSIRSTLALLYTIASAVIITVLWILGRFGFDDAISGIMMMPGFLLGYVAANRLRLKSSQRLTRIAVLSVSAIAAIALLLRSLQPGLTNG